jgi:hypothetical protein
MVLLLLAGLLAVAWAHDTSQIQEGAAPVISGPWMLPSATALPLHLGGHNHDCIVVPVGDSLVVLHLHEYDAVPYGGGQAGFRVQPAETTWQELGRIPCNRGRLGQFYWMTGDVQNMGHDEILTWHDRTVTRWRWTGIDFRPDSARFPYLIYQLRIGDVRNSGTDELVYFGCDSDYAYARYHLCIAHWGGQEPIQLWEDSTKLGYSRGDMGEFLLGVADVANLGYDQVLVSMSQSDVRPTTFQRLVWNQSEQRLQVQSRFELFNLQAAGQVSDTLMRLHARGVSGPAPSALPAEFESGPVSIFRVDDTTWLQGAVFGTRPFAGHPRTLRLQGDSLAASLPQFRNLPRTGTLFINPDGNGIGLLALTGSTFEFYRLVEHGLRVTSYVAGPVRGPTPSPAQIQEAPIQGPAGYAKVRASPSPQPAQVPGPYSGPWRTVVVPAPERGPAPGGALWSEAAAVACDQGRIDLVALGPGGNMYHDRYYPTGDWQGWTNEDGILVGPPAIASPGPGQLDCFMRGRNDHLWQKALSDAGHDWEDVGGDLAGPPAAVSWGANRVDVFARGKFGHVWHGFRDSVWHGWEDLGGDATTPPAVCSWGPNRLDLFIQGRDGHLLHRAFNGVWRDWEDLGGDLASAPAVTCWGPKHIDLFVHGRDDHVWHRFYDGTWHDWEDLGGDLMPGHAPAACTWGEGRLDCFILGRNLHIWHKWFHYGWTDWEDLGGAFWPPAPMDEYVVPAQPPASLPAMPKQGP